jgi:Uma2 family endonuclease
MPLSRVFEARLVYPESDGLPMADNTKQLHWIVVFFGNLSAQFRDARDVFVGGNQFWYPVEGEPNERLAQDVYVVFGRPKGDRPSYKQWEEANLPMTVVFEILSPGNTPMEMADKLDFYDRHGVEEYYVYDPDGNILLVYLRRGEVLRRIRPIRVFISPRMGIHFDMTGPEMVVSYPGGGRFLTFDELAEERDQVEQRFKKEQQRADEANQRADEANQRADRLSELTRKVLLQQATTEERRELDRLLNLSSS